MDEPLVIRLRESTNCKGKSDQLVVGRDAQILSKQARQVTEPRKGFSRGIKFEVILHEVPDRKGALLAIDYFVRFILRIPYAPNIKLWDVVTPEN